MFAEFSANFFHMQFSFQIRLSFFNKNYWVLFSLHWYTYCPPTFLQLQYSVGVEPGGQAGGTARQPISRRPTLTQLPNIECERTQLDTKRDIRHHQQQPPMPGFRVFVMPNT